METYMTLVLTDSYLIGAQVLAWSIKDSGSKKYLSVLVTKKTLSESTLITLNEIYDEVINVEPIYSKDIDKLNLFGRPDLHASLTKIHIWAQEKFKKIVYLDGDTFCTKNVDKLFDLDTDFAAIPDIGWPDIFNSGVFVTKPNISIYNSLINLAKNNISYDEFNLGGDQGLLNYYFSKWYRLPFIYNVVPSFSYQYLPAYNQFGSEISIVHFAGTKKPWILNGHNTNYRPYNELIEKWKSILRKHSKNQNLDEILYSKKQLLKTKETNNLMSKKNVFKNETFYKLSTQKVSLDTRTEFSTEKLKEQSLSSISHETTFFNNINYKNKWNEPFNPNELSFKPIYPLPMPENIKKEMEEYNKNTQIEKISPFFWNKKSAVTRVFLNDEPQKKEIDVSKYEVKITSQNVFLYYKTNKIPISKT
ncbi:uncharacterized protein T551_00240 [Pneumocystis jirovecii RU7]|uniref:glycogenin glucosyltransferase n=1 Tax=Pneumocystis jirovecii (strain RU7) TaxID=1408657 RepID=A0A0W4ZWN0_PNEJ7|nr:uncharacterized protein T551_00240 [Pneumocystis jirovecii RU7]KTW32755.1 hypothetical protein T551_00240 [Pneumocystis jirovecii RU7]